MKFNVSFRPYPAGAGTTVHDELYAVEGHCLACALDEFYQRKDFNPEWRVVNVTEVAQNPLTEAK